MIDFFGMLALVAMIVIGVLLLNKNNMGGIIWIAVAILVGGFINMMPSDSPWEYLFTSATMHDLEKGLFGAAVLFVFPIVCCMVLGKNLEELFNRDY